MPEIEVTPEHAADPPPVGSEFWWEWSHSAVGCHHRSHRAHTQAVIHRTESNDAWAYYQAKKNREYTSEVTLTLLRSLGSDPPRWRPCSKTGGGARQIHGGRRQDPGRRKAKDDETKIENGAHCALISAKDFWNWVWCCVPCIFWRATTSSLSSRDRRRCRRGDGHLGLPALRTVSARGLAFAVRRVEHCGPCVRRVEHCGHCGPALAAAPEAAPAKSPAPARVEARSDDLLAVGVTQGDRMIIRISRSIDNAPVRDAAVTVTLRGVTHPTIAEADGSFTLQTEDLALPGAAAVEFQVVQAAAHETLKGMLQVAGGAGSAGDKNSAGSCGGGCSISPCASGSCGSYRSGARRPRASRRELGRTGWAWVR